MTRILPFILALSLSECGMEIEKRGYVVRSISLDAAPMMISGTVTFDNVYLPENSSGTCIGIEVCNDTVE